MKKMSQMRDECLAVRKLHDWSLKGDTYRFSKYEISSLERPATSTILLLLFNSSDWYSCEYWALDGFHAQRTRFSCEEKFSSENSSHTRRNGNPRCFAGKSFYAMPIRVKTILHKTPLHRLCSTHVGEKRALRRVEHEDARKSGAYSLHRGEKSEVGPFSEKWVEKVFDCTHERARRARFHPGDARGRGVAGDDAGRPPPSPSPSSAPPPPCPKCFHTSWFFVAPIIGW